MSNKKKFVGVLLDDGFFDNRIREKMIETIEWAASDLRDEGLMVTKSALSAKLGMDRNRIVRICKALEIKHVFDCACKHCA